MKTQHYEIITWSSVGRTYIRCGSDTKNSGIYTDTKADKKQLQVDITEMRVREDIRTNGQLDKTSRTFKAIAVLDL